MSLLLTLQSQQTKLHTKMPPRIICHIWHLLLRKEQEATWHGDVIIAHLPAGGGTIQKFFQVGASEPPPDIAVFCKLVTCRKSPAIRFVQGF